VFGLNLAELLRHFVAGIVAVAFCCVVRPCLVKDAVELLGPAVFALATLSAGTMIYHVYRPFIHTHVALRLQDLTRPQNYRRRLKEKYVLSLLQADILWNVLKHRRFDKQLEFMRPIASGIHMLYMTCTLAVVFAAWAFRETGATDGSVLLGVAVVTGLAGYLSDAHIEDLQSRYLLKLDEGTRDQVAQELGFEKRTPMAGGE